jgi:signal transduction histidine kinase
MFSLSAYQYNPHAVAVATAGIGILVLGLVVWVHKLRSFENLAFFSISVSAFIWLLCFGMMSFAKAEGTARAWFPISYLGTPFISPCFYLFSVLWLNLRKQLRGALLSFLPAIIFSATILAYHKQFVEIRKFWWGYYDVFRGFGLVYLAAFLLFFYTLALKSFHNFYVARKSETSSLKKKQISYILVAFLVAYIGSVDYAPTIGIPIYPFGYLPVFLLIAVISFSIVKHKLLDVKLILKRTALLMVIYVTSLCLFFALDWPFYEWIARSIGQRWSIPFLVMTGSLLFSAGAFVYAHMVQSASFFKEQVVSGVTHEFKSPLASIQSAAEILMGTISHGESIESDKGKIADYVLMIQNNAQRLEKFIQELLEVAKIEQGKTKLQLSEANLNDLCLKAVEVYKPLAEKKNVRIAFVPNGTESVRCDPDKIQMVVSNLLSNAVKFTNQGRIELRIESQAGEARISVRDTGIGILQEDIPYIFEKFYQGKNGNGTKGTGLGLSIVKGWVEAHGGKVGVESNANNGTEISITIPNNK